MIWRVVNAKGESTTFTADEVDMGNGENVVIFRKGGQMVARFVGPSSVAPVELIPPLAAVPVPVPEPTVVEAPPQVDTPTP